MRQGNTLKWLSVLGLILASTVCVWADATVSVKFNGFSPASVSIQTGETVYFIVADDNGPYCIQSTTGAWTPWYLFDYGDSFGITFNERGDYYYRDAFTYNSGVIHVGTAPTNVPPSVSITSPTNGTVFIEAASFIFAADATDPDNNLTGVRLYIGTNLVDTLYAAPFSTSVVDLPASNYTLTAVAYDNASATRTNSVTITVQPWTAPTITLGPPTIVGGELRFVASGLVVGKPVVLQATADCAIPESWQSLQTKVATASTFPFSTPVVPGNQFFRVLQFP